MGALPAGRRRPLRLTGRWHVCRARADAGSFHRRRWPAPAAPTVWVFEVDRPALVLGSTQPPPVVEGVEVVRRHSGGGAVLLRPGEVVWVDVLVPTGDRLWDRDVNRAPLWLGRAWAGALEALGVGGVAVHQGGMVRTPWSRQVCFGGLGSGEVTVTGRKVVGISSRRRREGALFQCAALLEWDPTDIAAMFSVPVGELADVASGLPVTADELVAALLHRLALL